MMSRTSLFGTVQCQKILVNCSNSNVTTVIYIAAKTVLQVLGIFFNFAKSKTAITFAKECMQEKNIL